MDDGLLNKANDSVSSTQSDDAKVDETQSKIDEALDKLPDDLEKPVAPPVTPTPPTTPAPTPASPVSSSLGGDFNKAFASAGISSTPPPIPPQPKTDEPLAQTPPPPPVPPVTPPVEDPKPEVPEVKKEEPASIKPPKKGKRLGVVVKAVGGVALMALLVVGGLSSSKLLEQRQVINSEAWDDWETKTVGNTLYVYNPDKDKVETFIADKPASDNVKVGDDEEIDWNDTHDKLKNHQQAGSLDSSYVNSQGNIQIDNATGKDIENIANDPSTMIATGSDYGTAINATKKADEACKATYSGRPDRYDRCMFETLKTYGYAYTKTGGVFNENTSGKCDFWEGADINGDKNIDKDDKATLSVVDCATHYEKLRNGEVCGQLDQHGTTNFYVSNNPAVCESGGGGGDEEPDPPSSPNPSPPPGGPKQCQENCTATSECASGLGCIDVGNGKMCLNPSCTEETDCVCPTESYSCESLTGGTDVEYGDTETFTCTANFSAVNPVAFFRYNVDGGAYTTSGATTLSGSTASYEVMVDQYGSWEVQCRICTDSNATDCTTWGNAN